jgi:hypothetical protein
MTNRELLEKYDCLLLAKGIDPDAEASPELGEFLKEFQEESEAFDMLEKERMQEQKIQLSGREE